MNLDEQLMDWPKEQCIIKLVELSNDNEKTITWYPNILASRASIEGCPFGYIVQSLKY